MVHDLCPLPGVSSVFYHASWQVFWREKKNRNNWKSLEPSSFSRYPPSVHLSSVDISVTCHTYLDIEKARISNIFMNSANIRVNLWVRNTSFIWKQEEDDAWTQVGRFPWESMDLCQYMPCFSSAKSILLKLLMILFSRHNIFYFFLVLSWIECSNGESHRIEAIYFTVKARESYKVADWN